MRILKQTIDSYDKTYKLGYDKQYPSLELVRLEKFLFRKQGSLLDFGCGPGSNGIHFLNKGYDVTFCDISRYALSNVKKKIKGKHNFKIINLSNNKNFFSRNQEVFDYIICLSVFNNFQSKETATKYLNRFYSLLKNNGVLIIDSNIKNQHNYKLIDKKKNIFTTNPNNNYGLKMYFPKKREFVNMVSESGFKIKDIGESYFKIFNTYEKEVIISAIKKI